MSKAGYSTIGAANPMTVSDEVMPAAGVPGAEAGSILDFAERATKFKVDWVTYEKSNFLTKEELELLTSYISGSPEKRSQFLDLHGTTFFGTILSFLSKVSKNETLQYLLTLVNTIITEEPQRITLFHECAKIAGSPSWETFLHIVETKENLYVQHQANRILVKIAVSPDQLMPRSQRQIYFAWICSSIHSTERDASLLTLGSLQMLLRQEEYRRPFFEYANSIRQLRDILSRDASTNIQIQYMTMVVMWTLTFDKHIAGSLDQGTSGVIGEISALMRSSRKDKVIRMCLATLVNLLHKPAKYSQKQKNAELMISHKVLPYVAKRIETEDFGGDDDIEADLKTLHTKLDQIYEEMSSFDEYASEISSGLLEWSPVHRSGKFWRENAVRLNEDRYKLVKILIQLLETSSDPIVLAVAAHDCGEYVRHYPKGKGIIEKLGGKKYIMRHMTNKEHPQVRYEALVAVQKLMTQNYNSLGQQLKETMGGGGGGVEG